MEVNAFWSGVTLTGNETPYWSNRSTSRFWSGVTLTGNETHAVSRLSLLRFWSGVTLTGNETMFNAMYQQHRFGVVSP